MKDEKMAEEWWNNWSVKDWNDLQKAKELFIQAFLAGLHEGQEENNRLAQHIVELQKDKGNLIDENNHYKALVPVLEDNAEQLRNDLKQIKDLIRNIIRVTWGEGWNYSLDVKVKAEQFLKENGNG